jgi:hypothetical protein
MPYQPGQDLQQLVTLFTNNSLKAGTNPEAITYQPLYDELRRRQLRGNQLPIQVEYDYLRELVARYGSPTDRLLQPSEVNQWLDRQRGGMQAQPLDTGVMYVSLPELTASTARDIRQALYGQEFQRGIVLDLRAATGYDSQAVADVARLFQPRSASPLAVTVDRFGKPTNWDSNEPTLAENIPLVLLVDGQTRGAAATLATILASDRRTVVAGQPTQGSPEQSQLFTLPTGAAVELAIARWQLPYGGNDRALEVGLIPNHPLSPNTDWIAAAVPLLDDSGPGSAQLVASNAVQPTIFPKQGRIGRFALGADLGDPNVGKLGNVDYVPASSGEGVFRPTSTLKLFYLQDYVVFGYRNPGVLRSYFGDRIYMTAPDARTAEGIGIGDAYDRVIATYGPPGENGYNEISPYPRTSRVNFQSEQYYVNYDALGLSFTFDTQTNAVVAIGLFKPGS